MTSLGLEYWQQHHNAWQASGLNAATYCREHGLAERSFRRWSARIAPQPARPDLPKTERPVPLGRSKAQWRDVSPLCLEGGRPAMMAQLLSTRAFRRRKWTEVERQDVVWDLLQSGMPTYRYAETHNLSPSMLYRWLKELAEPIPGPHQPSSAADPPPVFATVAIAPGDHSDPPSAPQPTARALPVAPAPAMAGDLQIGLPNGAFLRVPVTVDPVTLRGILDALAVLR